MAQATRRNRIDAAGSALRLPRRRWSRSAAALASVFALCALAAAPLLLFAQEKASTLDCVEGEALWIEYDQSTRGCKIGTPGETDVFELHGLRGTHLRVVLRGFEKTLTPRLVVLDPEKNVVRDEYCESFDVSCSVSVHLERLEQTGLWRILVSDARREGTGAYELGLHCVFGPCDSDGDGQPDPTRPGLAYDVPRFDESVDSPTDSDAWLFEAVKGTAVRVALQSDAKLLRPRLEVLDPSGRVVADEACLRPSPDGACDVWADLEPVEQTGTYRVIVSDARWAAAGAYDLGVRCAQEDLCVSESFDVYPPQIDRKGTVVSGRKLVYSITSDGQPAEEGGVIVTASGDLAKWTALEGEGENLAWVIRMEAGRTKGPRVEGAIPGESDVSTTGPFARLFAKPRNLEGHSVGIRIRGAFDSVRAAMSEMAAEEAEECTLEVRLIVIDEDGNRTATELSELGPEYDYIRHEIDKIDFNTPVGEHLLADFERITGMTFEIYSSCEETAAGTIEVDDVVVSDTPVPEPSRLVLGIVAALTLSALRSTGRSRRRAP